MREILFRGKTPVTGEWVEGNLIQITEPLIRCEIKLQSPDESVYLVDPETVGQYIGLTDENGKKIFEGDIAEYEDEAPGQYEYHDSLIINRGVIKYSEGSFYWTNAVNANLQDSAYKGVADCKVIGNIYDNSELLEE